jgi:adenylate kinase family enzyme
VPLLGPTDPLSRRPRRVLVAGTSGSGKSTAAARIADLLGAPHVEIDGLFHGPGWTPRASFEDDVRRFLAEPAWVTEWQYRAVRPLLAERADLLVWLDLPRAFVMWQVARRTVRRRLNKTVLWNGNVEPPLRTFFSDPEHIVRWAWRTHQESSARTARLVQQRPELDVVRIRSRSELCGWISGPLRSAVGSPPAP